MSYCRWSSDNFRCDLYIYEDVSGGYTTHVAAHRYRGPVPEVTADILKEPKKHVRQNSVQSKYLDSCGVRRIRLRHAGKTFNDRTLPELLKRIRMLRNIGYRMPQYVLKNIVNEIKDLKKTLTKAGKK